jgi:SpoVK/Ycf46/Vps4 family AAA+-type ATPase
VYRVVSSQFANHVQDGIRGFVFYGSPGTGKSFMAKVLAHELKVPLIYRDSGSTARRFYGQSEAQITKAFAEASGHNCIILFDDAESLFPDRHNPLAENWNLDENNVMFHQIDVLDTSKAVIILTTNLLDMMDKALADRLYLIEFPEPETNTVIEIARARCKELNVSFDKIEKTITQNPKDFRSVRMVERLVTEHYIEVRSEEALEMGVNVSHPLFS